MPELPEVETVCRIMRSVLIGRKIVTVEVADDPIVLSGVPKETYESVLLESTVESVGRRGKYWWLALDRKPWVFGHLGMAGWIRELGAPSARLREHGSKPFEDEEGRPRFLKLFLGTDEGKTIAFTDGRRLGRLWLGEGPDSDKRVSALGPDALDELPSAKALAEKWRGRTAPIKALLLDQSQISGVGNYLADEALYQAGISPKREAGLVKTTELEALRTALTHILLKAVEVGADSDKFPQEWLFHQRWGGMRGSREIEGQPILRESVGGRTTAWVPSRQR